jgi:hypothetical protein
VVQRFGGGAGVMLLEPLDGEGVFEAFDPCFQALQLPPLLFDEQVFNLAKAGLDAIQPRFDTIELHVVVGKPFADHVSDFINGFLDGGFHILLVAGIFPIVFIDLWVIHE